MIVTISISKFIFELPVPVTAFSQTMENDISTNAEETTRITGMAACTKKAFVWQMILLLNHLQKNEDHTQINFCDDILFAL